MARVSSGRDPDPRLAFMLSTILPGFGQWAAGRLWRGVAWLTMASALLAAVVWKVLSAGDEPGALRRAGPALVVLLLGLLAVLILCWADARRLARRSRSPAGESPEAALMFSVLFPGLGQLYVYARRWWLWIVLPPLCLAPAAFLMAVDTIEPGMIEGWPGWLTRWPWWVASLAGTALSVAAAVQAYVGAARRAGRPVRLPALSRPLWGLVLAAWLVGELPWQGWLKERVRSFKIPSSSMEPTLLIGDRLWAKKLPRYARGEIVVFEPPGEVDVEYIKRVVGLPGETVRVHRKLVSIDGKRLMEPYAVHRDEIIGYPIDEFGPVKIPPDCLFLMGDNRDNSKDSRYFGVVPVARIYGRAFKLFWPLARAGLLARPAPPR